MHPKASVPSTLALGLLVLLVLVGCGPSATDDAGGVPPAVPAEATAAAKALIELETTRETRPADAFYPAPMYGIDRS